VSTGKGIDGGGEEKGRKGGRAKKHVDVESEVLASSSPRWRPDFLTSEALKTRNNRLMNFARILKILGT